MIRHLFTRYRVIVQVCLLLTSLIFLFLSSVLHFGTILSLVFFSLATSMMASVLVSFFESLMGTDIPTALEQRLKFNRQVYDLGLEAVHLHRDISIFEKFGSAHAIDIMANSAKSICYTYGRRMLNAIEKHNCNIRIIISDPDHYIWGKSEISNALCPATNIPGEIKDTINYVQQLAEEMKSSKSHLKGGSIELRMYSIVPTCSIIILNDDFIRHTSYLPYHHSSESPTLDVTRERGEQLFLRYQDTFNSVWKHSQPIFKVNWSTKSNQKRSTPPRN